MALSDFNKNREVLKIKNYKEFIAQEKLKKPEWLKIKISPNRQTIKEVKNYFPDYGKRLYPSVPVLRYCARLP